VHSPLQMPEEEQQGGATAEIEEQFETAGICERRDEQINLLSITADPNFMNRYVTLLMDIVFQSIEEIINIETHQIQENEGYLMVKG
ncbi:unnamed protein product, partial [Didymodactylos carnosus]